MRSISPVKSKDARTRLRLFKLSLFLFTCGASCFGAPEFVGVLVSNGTAHFAVRAVPTEQAVWVSIGEKVGEYRIVAYDPRQETLSFVREREKIEVPLRNAKVQSAATLALLENLVRKGDDELRVSLESLRTLDGRRNKTAAELANLEARAASNPDLREQVAVTQKRLLLEDSNLERFLQALTSVVHRKVAGSTR